MNKRTVMTIHCPEGIRERDLRTYFERFQDGVNEAELCTSLHKLRHHGYAVWTNATLTISGQWGSVCFIAGRGENRFCIKVNNGHQWRCENTLENLFSGFFRCLIAMATVWQGTLIAIHFVHQMTCTYDTTDLWSDVLRILIVMRHILGLSTAAFILMETAYGPKTPRGFSWTVGCNPYSQSPVKNIVMKLNQRKPIPGNHFDNLLQWNKDSRSTVHKENQLQRLPALQISKEAQRQQLTNDHGRDKTFKSESSYQQNLPWSRDRTVTAALNNAGKRQEINRRHMSLSRRRWLLRAGIYWALAASMLPEATLLDGILKTSQAVPGGLLYVAGFLALVAQCLGLLYPRLLKRPWTRVTDVDEEFDQNNVKCCLTGWHHGRNVEEKANNHNIQSCFSRIHHSLESLAAFLAITVVGAVHIVHFASKVSRSRNISDDNLTGQTLASRSQPLVQNSHTAKLVPIYFYQLLPFAASLTFTTFLSVWLAVAIGVPVYRARSQGMLGYTGAWLYVCCVSTLWSQDVWGCIPEVVIGDALGGHDGIDLFPVTPAHSSWARSVCIAVSATALVCPAIAAIAHQVCHLHKCDVVSFLKSLVPGFAARINCCRFRVYFPRYVFLRLLHAVAVTSSLCSLGLAVLALQLPWLTVRIRFSQDILPLTQTLQSLSVEIKEYTAVMDTLITFPVCQKDKVSSLASTIQETKADISRLQVDQIEKYCLEFECQTTNTSYRSTTREYVTASYAQKFALCDTFCNTWSFFSQKVAFNASVHSAKAKDVIGHSDKERSLLHQLILEQKSRLLADLGTRNGQTEHLTWTGQGHNHTSQHTACMRVLCTLRAGSLAGLALPLVGKGFYVAFVALQSMISFLEMAIKADEFRTVFSNFSTRVESLALYLELGTMETTISFSIANYSMIYMAYPALITGCLGALVGFWQRKGLSVRRGRRYIFIVLLPLLALNVIGIIMNVAVTYLIKAVSSYTNLLDVTSSPLIGANLLLASLTFSSCACVLFLGLALGACRWPYAHELDGQCVSSDRPSEGCEYSANVQRKTVNSRDCDKSQTRSAQCCHMARSQTQTENCDFGWMPQITKPIKPLNDVKVGPQLCSVFCTGAKRAGFECSSFSLGLNQSRFSDNLGQNQDLLSDSLRPKQGRVLDNHRVNQGHFSDSYGINQGLLLDNNYSNKILSLNSHATDLYHVTPDTDLDCVTPARQIAHTNSISAIFKSRVTDIIRNKPVQRKHISPSDPKISKNEHNMQSFSNGSEFQSSQVSVNGRNYFSHETKEKFQDSKKMSQGLDCRRHEDCKSPDTQGRHDLDWRHKSPGAERSKAWLIAVVLSCVSSALMTTCMLIPSYCVHVDLHRDLEMLLTQLADGGSAVEVGRQVLLSQDSSKSCDVMEFLGREVLLLYVERLKGLQTESLLREINVLRQNTKVTTNAILPLLTVPSLLAVLVGTCFVVYGSLTARFLHPKSRWILSLSQSSSIVHRLTMSSLAWLLHTSLALAGPATKTVVPFGVEFNTQLASGFTLALVAHVILAIGKKQLFLVLSESPAVCKYKE